jgi:pilus assembly protein Flp/PilA
LPPRGETPEFKDKPFPEEIPMLSIFRRLTKNEKGATAIEYTLIASLIAVAAITAMGTVGNKVNAVLSNTASSMK